MVTASSSNMQTRSTSWTRIAGAVKVITGAVRWPSTSRQQATGQATRQPASAPPPADSNGPAGWAQPAALTVSKTRDHGSQVPDPWRRMANSGCGMDGQSMTEMAYQLADLAWRMVTFRSCHQALAVVIVDRFVDRRLS